MVLSPERFFTNVARVRSLVRVSTLVYQQVVALGELPTTKPAYELFFGTGRPTDAGTRAHGRCPWSGRDGRAVRRRTGTGGRSAK